MQVRRHLCSKIALAFMFPSPPVDADADADAGEKQLLRGKNKTGLERLSARKSDVGGGIDEGE